MEDTYALPPGYSRGMNFWYGVAPIVVAAGANVPGQLVVDSDSDFEWRGTTYFVTSAGVAQPYTDSSNPVPILLAQVSPQGQNTPFSNSQVPLSSIAGRGNLPYILPYPLVLLRSNGVTFQLSNLEGANSYTVYITLHGRKLFT